MDEKIDYEHLTVKQALEEYGVDTKCVLPEKFDGAFIGISHTDIPMYDAKKLEELGYNPDIDGNDDCSIVVELLKYDKPLNEELDDDTVVLEPRDFLNAAIIGKINGTCKAVYDYNLLIDAFIHANEGWDAEDAEDWISYNTIRAIPFMGTSAPVVMFDLSYMM